MVTRSLTAGLPERTADAGPGQSRRSDPSLAVTAPRAGDPPDVTAAVLAALSNFRRRFDALDRSLATDRGFYLDIIV